MSKTNVKYIAWMVGAMIFAIIFGQFLVEPGRVSDYHPTHTATAPARGGRGAVAVRPPAVTQAAPDTAGGVSAPVIPKYTRDNVTSYSELRSVIDESPTAIRKVTFLNGGGAVDVTFAAGGPPRRIGVPAGTTQDSLVTLLTERKVLYDAKEDSSVGTRTFISSFLPIIIIGGIMIGLFLWSRKNQMGVGGSNMGFTKSRAKTVDAAKFDPVQWNDIAGADEAVRELKRIVKGLTSAGVYNYFGGKRPKGVLLVGPPGTGKTLLARAVATACEGTMDITSGSDFVEMFVGVGAARVRDMVEKGKANVKRTGKPHIIFIDEIDAIGGKRGSGAAGEHKNDEREQTLNQILVSMDGLESSEGIIWIAATNRPEMLDEALLRPGRYDSQVTVDLPDTVGRTKIFKIHTRKKPLAADVSCEKLATRTYSYSGAEIELASNRAALLAAERWAEANPGLIADAEREALKAQAKPKQVWTGVRSGPIEEAPDDQDIAKARAAALDKFMAAALRNDPSAKVTLEDFDEAIDYVRYGDARKSRQDNMGDETKKNTAYHEAGHAVVAEVMPGADPVAKITIMSRSKALGYVQQIPDGDKYSTTDKFLISRIVMAMAGRAAQEVYLNTCDTGASNDFEQATDLARRMVTEWGMSRLRHIAVGRRTSMGMRGGQAGGGIGYGASLANEIDAEWRRIVEACYDLAIKIVTEEKARIEKVVEILMKQETILRDEWKQIMSDNKSACKPEELVFNPRALESNARTAPEEVSDGQ
jgi:ATP-dependent Zn proteases